MKIIRYQQPGGSIGWAELRSDGSAAKIRGDLLGEHQVTGEIVQFEKLLAPIQPTGLLCIGLNYRQHAEETKATLPKFPILFMKGVNAVQDPGAPIVLPRWLRSERVDYECELAVVIGKAARNVPRERACEFVRGWAMGERKKLRYVCAAGTVPCDSRRDSEPGRAPDSNTCQWRDAPGLFNR